VLIVIAIKEIDSPN